MLESTRRWSSCATAAPGRPTAARSRSSDVALHSLHTEDQEQIMGTASHLAQRVAGAVRRPARRGRGRRRDRRGHGREAGHGRRLRRRDQPDHRERAGRGRHGDGARIRPDGGARPRRSGPSRSTPASARTGSTGPTTRLPTEVFLVQTMEPSGPFGAKAVGEIPVDGVAPGGAQRDPRRHRRRPRRAAADPGARLERPARFRRTVARGQPLTTPIGTRRATRRASPARSTTSTTRSTSL